MMKALKFAGILLLIMICVAAIILAAAFFFLRFYPSVGKLPDEDDRRIFAEQSKQYHGGQFRNENAVRTISGEGYPSSPRRKPKTKIPAERPELSAGTGPADLTFTWLGHSSFLLQTGGMNVLADPVLSGRSSPVSFAGPERFSEIPLSAEEMPRIDLLLISHDHYDHLDYRTIRKLRDKVDVFAVPLGVDAILRGWGIDEERIHALDWWESIEINGTTVTLTPSQHFTGRDPLRTNRTLWGGYYLRNEEHSVYYTGDGGYCGAFRQVCERLGAPELMIAECGQYDTVWPQVHMFPEETVKAAKDVQAGWTIPVHWGAFCICNHAWDDPARRVTAEAEKEDLLLATPRIGQTVDYSRIGSYREAWWEEYE